MGWKFTLLLIVFAFIGGFMRGYSEGPEKVLTVEKNNTITNTVVNETVCYKIETVNISRVSYVPETVRITINTTSKDVKQILNLRPNCEGTGCNYGFILGKYAVMDVLGLPHPKFSEKPPTNIRELFDAKNASQCLPLQDDGFGKYIRLDNSKWNIYQGFDPPKQKALTLRCGNETAEYKVWTMENRTSDDSIYLRLV